MVKKNCFCSAFTISTFDKTPIELLTETKVNQNFKEQYDLFSI